MESNNIKDDNLLIEKSRSKQNETGAILTNDLLVEDYFQDEQTKRLVEEHGRQIALENQLQREREDRDNAAVKARNEHAAYLESKRYWALRTLDKGILALSKASKLAMVPLKMYVSPLQKLYRVTKTRIKASEWYKQREINERAEDLERMRKRLIEDVMLSDQEKTELFYDMLKQNPDSVAIWREKYKASLEAEFTFQGQENEILHHCEQMFRQEREKKGVSFELDMKDALCEKVRERDKSKREESLAHLDETVTQEQREAVQKADRWLLGRATRKDAPLAFVRRVMGASIREKLFMYHQIENGRLSSAGGSDVLVSQTGYIPNLSVIKSRMRSMPFHLWNKIRHRGARKIYWDKLDGAFELARDAALREEIKTYAAIDQVKEAEKLDFTGVLKAAARCQQAVERRDNSIFFMRRVRNEKVMEEAQNTVRELQLLLNNLFEQNPQLKELTKGLSQTGKSGYKESEETVNHLKFAFAQFSSTASKINQIPLLYTDDIKEIAKQAAMTGSTAMFKGMNVQHLITGTNAVSGSFTTITGIMALKATLDNMDAAVNAVATGDLDIGSIATTLLGIGKGLVSGGFATSAGITSLIYAPALGQQSAGLLSQASKWTGSIESMKTGMKAAGATVSALALGADMVSAGVQVRNAIHHRKGSNRIAELKREGKLNGLEADYADGILRLDKRNKRKKAIQTTASMIGNATTLTTTLIGGPVAALSGLAINLTTQLVTKITTDLMTKSTMKKTVDEFLKVDDPEMIRSMIKVKDQESFDINTITKDKKLMSAIKDKVREYMAAELGYSSYKTLYKHVVKNYASFMFRKLFFYNDEKGNPHPYTDKTVPKNDKEIEAFTHIVKGLGLRVKYPTDTVGTGRHPSPMMIAAKLMG